MKQGTEWTKPGEGASILAIWRRVFGEGELPQDITGLRRQVFDHLGPYADGYRTNLRLTGEPLTAEDLERIAKCK